MLGATLKAGESANTTSASTRHAYLVPARRGRSQRRALNARDGAAIRDEAALTVTALEDAELVLVDAA